MTITVELVISLVGTCGSLAAASLLLVSRLRLRPAATTGTAKRVDDVGAVAARQLPGTTSGGVASRPPDRAARLVPAWTSPAGWSELIDVSPFALGSDVNIPALERAETLPAASDGEGGTQSAQTKPERRGAAAHRDPRDYDDTIVSFFEDTWGQGG